MGTNEQRQRREEWDNHVYIVDSQEQIKMCLSCDRPTCVNCIAQKGKIKHLVSSREEFDLNLLAVYADCKSVYEILNKMGAYRKRVERSLKRLNLPNPGKLDKEERETLVQERRKELLQWKS